MQGGKLWETRHHRERSELNYLVDKEELLKGFE